METILLVLTIGILCIVCFFIGAKTGQSVVEKRKIKIPNISRLNPLSIHQRHEEKEEMIKEQEKLKKIIQNVERYDGTELGQEDI